MDTDTLFYRLFRLLPECYFELLGLPARLAGGYRFTAEELKQTARRLDGVFLPNQAGQPVHFVEVYTYLKPQAYANLFGKVFQWLEQHDATQDWHACVIFADRQVEPPVQEPYRALLASEQVTRIYLDELAQGDPQPLGLGILALIATPTERVEAQAKVLLRRARQLKKPMAERRQVLDLIETVVLRHFPNLSRQELEAMLQIRDLRETKVYQEALAEGQEQGLVKGREQEREKIALRLLTDGLPASKVATLTNLPVARVRTLKKKAEQES